jgi:hypothetical protein
MRKMGIRGRMMLRVISISLDVLRAKEGQPKKPTQRKSFIPFQPSR